MKRFALAAILCLFMIAGLSHRAFAVEDRTIHVPNVDAEMNAAIEKARKSLPLFWEKLAKPGEGESGFTLKVKIEDGGYSEHFWVIDIERKGETIFGTIDNTPEEVKSVTMGQRIRIAPDQISDWMYMHNRKMVGNETLRVLLARMPKQQADALRAMLENP
ncbi:MAG: YegJ family protein [Rhodomicrobium sp.]